MAGCHEADPNKPVPASPTCKHCSACYLASALLLPSIAATPVVAAAHNVIPHVGSAFVGFIPDSPERPPRTVFA
jgi:hypothetical protein